jgi:hypothetical protein
VDNSYSLLVRCEFLNRFPCQSQKLNSTQEEANAGMLGMGIGE